jgi:DNA-binding CsgD family transcriptional regulator
VGPRSTSALLTAREREVASLVGRGLTNRQIGARLGISERTVGAHVQNILNKLDANNRAQIATWSATSPQPPALSSPSVAVAARPAVTPMSSPVARPRPNRWFVTLAGLGLASLLISSDTGIGQSPAEMQSPVRHGGLAYQAQMDGSGSGFSIRYALGDPDASAIRFFHGAVEYSVLKPGGNTGNSLAMRPLVAYFAEVELSVRPGSAVVFWFDLRTGDGSNQFGQHLVYIDTQAQAMQLAYFVDGDHMEYMGPQVSIQRLQEGRRFIVSALVKPPQYQIFLDGASVINVRHEPSPPRQGPSLAIFGNGTGTVRVTAIRVYSLS